MIRIVSCSINVAYSPLFVYKQERYHRSDNIMKMSYACSEMRNELKLNQ
jgi:hypothetical protein